MNIYTDLWLPRPAYKQTEQLHHISLDTGIYLYGYLYVGIKQH